jgi:hypothetical protein
LHTSCPQNQNNIIYNNLKKTKKNIGSELTEKVLLLIEANSKNKGQNNDTSICIDSQFLSYFPLKNAKGFFLFENRIKNELEFVPKLVISHYLCYLNLLKKYWRQ